MFPNKDEVIGPGLHARIDLPLGKPHKALMVAERAIGSSQGEKYVYVVNDKNEVVERAVKAGLLQGHLRVIASGLKPDERIIVSGLQRVRPGMTVDPKPAEMSRRSLGGRGRRTRRLASGIDQAPRTRKRLMARFFIDRPVFAWVISIVIVLAGLAAAWMSAGGAISGDHAAHGASDLPVSRAPAPWWWPTPWPRRSSSKSTASRTCSTCLRKAPTTARTR